MPSESKEVHFEDRITKIKEIINKLNNTEITLKDAMQLYKDGVNELDSAQKMLEEAKQIFDEINQKGQE